MTLPDIDDDPVGTDGLRGQLAAVEDEMRSCRHDRLVLELSGSPSAPLARTTARPSPRSATVAHLRATGKPAPPRPRRPLASRIGIRSAAVGRGPEPALVVGERLAPGYRRSPARTRCRVIDRRPTLDRAPVAPATSPRRRHRGCFGSNRPRSAAGRRMRRRRDSTPRRREHPRRERVGPGGQAVERRPAAMPRRPANGPCAMPETRSGRAGRS